MDVHYAPTTPAFRVERDQLPLDPRADIHWVLLVGDLPARLTPFPSSLHDRGNMVRLREPDEAARNLYARLREIDAEARDRVAQRRPRIDFLIIIPPPDEPRWRAVRDRIWRATKPWPGQGS